MALQLPSARDVKLLECVIEQQAFLLDGSPNSSELRPVLQEVVLTGQDEQAGNGRLFPFHIQHATAATFHCQEEFLSRFRAALIQASQKQMQLPRDVM